MTTALSKLTQTLATKLDMGDGADLIHTLKATAFKGQVSDAQMTALLVVANQYGLNPWVKEIYAFPDKQNGIVPVVGVDGWSRIMNEHPQFDGIDFEQDAESCTCIIYRKDRTRPIKVTEWMSECKRGTGPWSSHPRRMLRHKAMIQCARLAFGFGGIYDQDEAERIVDAQPAEKHMGMAEEVPPAPYSQEQFEKNFPIWRAAIEAGKKTAAQVIDTVQTKAPLTPEQQQAILACTPAPPATDVQPKHDTSAQTAAPAVNPEKLAQAMQTATDLDALYEQGSLLDAVTDEGAHLRLNEIFDAKVKELEGT